MGARGRRFLGVVLSVAALAVAAPAPAGASGLAIGVGIAQEKVDLSEDSLTHTSTYHFGPIRMTGALTVGGARFLGTFAVAGRGTVTCDRDVGCSGGSSVLAVTGRDLRGKAIGGSCAVGSASDALDDLIANDFEARTEVLNCNARITGGVTAPFVVHVDLHNVNDIGLFLYLDGLSSPPFHTVYRGIFRVQP